LAVLKEKSPSCGVHQVYDGTFSSTLTPGAGVTAALLAANNIRVFSELELETVEQLLRTGTGPDAKGFLA
jgi:uncharacterized protein YbbK (DUF523 family)